jgi:hypothetical protein
MTDLGRRWRLVILVGLFFAAVGMAVYTIRPIHSASVGPDAVAPVIELERLLAGRPVEGHLTQTSKPFFDVVYGSLYELTGDWRPVAWAAVVAFALSVVLATVLAHRVGGLASAAFAAAAFILSPILLVDLSLAYAVTWMTLFLLVAGLAVTSVKPRYGLAGLALLLAALTRPESLAVVGVAAATLIAARIWAAARRRPPPPRGAWLVLMGFLAIPILMAHDQLLFGDSLFWTKTAVLNSEGRNVRGLVGMIGWIWQHFLGQAALLPLAAVAAWLTVSRRQWGLAVGLAGVVLGIATLFIASGTRGTFLSSRYLVPIDLGLLLAAAIGVSALDVPALRRWTARRLRPGWRHVVLPIAGGLLVALAIAPIAQLDPAVRASITTQIRLHANARRAMAAIRSELGPVPDWRGLPASQAISAHPRVIVPVTLRAQAVADLGLPLGDVAYSYRTSLDPVNGLPTAGAIVYHDRRDDDPTDPRYSLLEISEPTTIGAYRYVPILADPAAGMWVVRVENASP